MAREYRDTTFSVSLFPYYTPSYSLCRNIEYKPIKPYISCCAFAFTEYLSWTRGFRSSQTDYRRPLQRGSSVSLPIDDVVTPQNRSPRTHDHRAWCVLCAALACPPRAASPCPFVSSCQPTTRQDLRCCSSSKLTTECGHVFQWQCDTLVKSSCWLSSGEESRSARREN